MISNTSPVVEIPVVTFPLRGRFNPYFWWLLPLIGLTLAAALLSLGSLLAVCLAPGSAFIQSAPGIYKAGVVVAIIIYSLTLSLCIVMCSFYGLTLFNLLDTKFTQVVIDLVNVITIILFIVVSAIVIAAEASLADAVFQANIVRRYALLTAGILGFSASFCLITALFFSRFYEYCIGNYKSRKSELLKAANIYSYAA